MVAATTAYRTQNAKMGCYQSGPTYRKEPRNSAISRCFWAFNYIYACIKDCVLIDPCCGGGYALTILGYYQNRYISKIYGSDIDEDMVAHAKKNTSLLTSAALKKRKTEIEELYNSFGKESHKEALRSCDKVSAMLEKEVIVEIFQADCTMPLPNILPDIIITDVPYGNLVEWEQGKNSIADMLEQLWRISHENTILAVCMDKKQKINCEKWERLEKQNIGKRKFEILKKK